MFLFHVSIRILKKKLKITENSVNQVCQTIEKQLGESMDDLFTNFVSVPLATASVRTFLSLLTTQYLFYFCINYK